MLPVIEFRELGACLGDSAVTASYPVYLIMLFTAGIVLLALVVLVAVVGAAPPHWLLLATLAVSTVCLQDVSGWVIAAAMLCLYGVSAFAWGLVQQLRDLLTSNH